MVGMFVQWMLVLALSAWHPHHVATTTIEHNAADQTLEITIKMFPDDLEKSLKKLTRDRVNVLDESKKEQSSQLIRQYVVANLRLEADGKLLELDLVGFEEEKGSVLLYFEVSEVTAINKLKVTNTLLHDTQKQQVNIVQFKTGQKVKTANLRYPTSSYLFQL